MTDIITIDREALNARLDGGALWVRGWGDWASESGSTCAHGAIRYCQLVPGDAYLIEQVGARKGYGIKDNDRASEWAEIYGRIPEVITDADLLDTFGPQWEAIVALVRRAAVLTEDESSRLAAAWAATRDAAWDAAWDAARDAARYAAWDAARALVVRDLIGQHGFTQEHYESLAHPWASVIGPAHPDDQSAKEA